MSDLTIRPIGLEHLPTFVELRNRANPWMRDETVDEVRQREEISPQLRFFGELDGRPVAVGGMGAGIFSVARDILVNVAVSEEHRGRGFGTLMFEELLRHVDPAARTLGCWVPTCCAGSVALARKFGFREMFRTRELKLDLTTFDSAPFQADQERVRAAGVRITSLREVDSPAARRAVFELFSEVGKNKRDLVIFNVGDFDEWNRKVLQSPNTDLETLTLAMAGDRFVGISMTWTWPGGDIYGLLTDVLPDWRRPDVPIGLAMKLRNINVLRERGEPLLRASESVRKGETLNTRLGFQPAFARIRGTRPVILPAGRETVAGAAGRR
jgi:GNAT superfamily N-acetyltransferase